jgi:hypothetical protein
MYSLPRSNRPIPAAYDNFQNHSPMDFSCFNTETATRPAPCPELSYPLTEEELDDLWFLYVLEFGHLGIPVSAISSGP